MYFFHIRAFITTKMLENMLIKKRLDLIFRAKGVEYSMEKVFDTVYPHINNCLNANKSYMPYYGAGILCMIGNLLTTLFRRRADIYHITGMVNYCALLLPSNKTVITIHDVNLGNKGIKRKLLFTLFFYLPIKHAKYITCVSNTTRLALVELCPFAESKTRVIYNPISSQYKYVEKEFNKDLPRILHIGTRPNKNLERVIKSLRGLNAELIVVGRLCPSQEELLKNSGIRYVNKYNLTDKQILEEYISCDIVSFPSLFEGFGMPIIEGNAIGRPVLTSNIEPMLEVSGNAARIVDPYSIEDIKQGFLDLINSSELRKSLVNRGLENAKKYNEVAIADEYIKLYKEIVNE